jgi:hypothetical protein
MSPAATPNRAFYRADPTMRASEPVRLALLLVPPLMLAVLETLHPQPEPTVPAMLEVATWFATFHAIQLVLIGLVGLSVLLLADTLGRANAWVTRIGVGMFLVFFGAYDTLAGIGTGLAMRTARDLTATQQDAVLTVVEDWPGLGPPFALSILGTAGWVLAVGGLAQAAYRKRAPRGAWIALGLAALFLMGGHPFPAGTLAFGSFLVAALTVEWRFHRNLRTEAERRGAC